MRGVVLLGRIQGTGVETYRSHHLVVFSLADVSSNSTITGVCDEYDGVWRVWVDWSTDGCVVSETFDIVKGFLLLFPQWNMTFFLVRWERTVDQCDNPGMNCPM